LEPFHKVFANRDEVCIAMHSSEHLTKKGWKREECDGKDNRNNTSRNELNRQDALYAAICSVTMDTFCIVNGNNSLRFVDFHKEIQHRKPSYRYTQEYPERERVYGERKPVEDMKLVSFGRNGGKGRPHARECLWKTSYDTCKYEE
jgi:hypothetical protein